MNKHILIIVILLSCLFFSFGQDSVIVGVIYSVDNEPKKIDSLTIFKLYSGDSLLNSIFIQTNFDSLTNKFSYFIQVPKRFDKEFMSLYDTFEFNSSEHVFKVHHGLGMGFYSIDKLRVIVNTNKRNLKKRYKSDVSKTRRQIRYLLKDVSYPSRIILIDAPDRQAPPHFLYL
jgi:hypothetical protein